MVGLATAGAVSIRRRSMSPLFGGTPWERSTWTMPALETIPPPARSRARAIGLVVLRVYVTLAVLLLVVKAIRLIG